MSIPGPRRNRWAYWFAKPVSVQFKNPYVLCRDSGPEDVTVEEDGVERSVQFGKPEAIVSEKGPIAAVSLEGHLYEDPYDPERLVMHSNRQVPSASRAPENVKIVVRIDPDNVAFITTIPERTEPPRIVSPIGSLDPTKP